MVHMAKHGTLLSTWPIVKKPHGPVPDHGREILARLERDGLIRQERVVRGPYEAWDVETPNLEQAKQWARSFLSEEEFASIAAAAEHLGQLSAAEASQWSHGASRSWREAEDDAELDIYGDLVMDDEELQALRDRIEAAGKVVDEILGSNG